MKPAMFIACISVLALSACKPEAGTPQSVGTTPVIAEATVAHNTAQETPAATPELPTLKLQTVDGKPYELAAHRGKWVVVNFWATWCAPCIKEMPELSELDKRREDVEVVGLAYEEIEPQAMRDFLKQRPVVYPVAILDVYAPPADFATPRGLPMTYLIAPDGKVTKQFLGPVTAREIETAIAAGAAA